MEEFDTGRRNHRTFEWPDLYVGMQKRECNMNFLRMSYLFFSALFIKHQILFFTVRFFPDFYFRSFQKNKSYGERRERKKVKRMKGIVKLE